MTPSAHLLRSLRLCLLVLVVLSAALLLPACSDSAFPATAPSASSTQSTAPGIDRQNPESVMRGYFWAWQSGDWEGQASFMAEQYARMVPEPVESLRIIELRRVEGSSTECLYEVVFEIKVKGRSVSMTSGRYDWTYDLKWDGQRQSWIITNYGEG